MISLRLQREVNAEPFLVMLFICTGGQKTACIRREDTAIVIVLLIMAA